jgi:hypothetical protein
MPGSAHRSIPATSVDSPKRGTPAPKVSTNTDDAQSRLGRLQERLRRLRQGGSSQVITMRPPSDPTKLADELELVGAKINTLATELRVVPLDDPQTVERTMNYLQECYATLARAVEDRPHWSRA